MGCYANTVPSYRSGSKRMPRSLTSLLTALTFLVMAATGVLAFVRPFSSRIVGLHALMGFAFMVLIALHAWNNRAKLVKYGRRKTVWLPVLAVLALGMGIYFQAPPVGFLMSLSPNRGPDQDRFAMSNEGMVYEYLPDPKYRMALSIRAGSAYNPEAPPDIAIWLENQSSYHIKTLYASPAQPGQETRPYWAYKVREYEKAKEKAASGPQVDAVSSPTRNDSFDPADYILPGDLEDPLPYQLLVEINQVGDTHDSFKDQPSLIYSVQIDNLRPSAYQLLRLEGSPQVELEDGKEKWAIYYVDEGLGSALKLIDSALLTIDRD